MKATYTSHDGFKFNGNESFISLAVKSALGRANLFSDFLNNITWTAANSGVVAKDGRYAISLTNGAAAYAQARKSATVESGAWYLFRAYVIKSDAFSVNVWAGSTPSSYNYAVSPTSTKTETEAWIEFAFKTSSTALYIQLNHQSAGNIQGLASYWSKMQIIKINSLGVDETTELHSLSNAAKIGTDVNATTGFSQVGLDSGLNNFVSVDVNGDRNVEKHTTANAASLTNEANATTGFTASGSSLVSSAAYKYAGNYSILTESNGTPTAGAKTSFDLSALGLVSGRRYFIHFYVAHVGTGGTWAIGLGSAPSSVVYSLASIPNTETSFALVSYDFIYDSNHRYLVLYENNAGNDGGLWFDALSIKEIGNLVENGNFVADQVWTKGTGWSIGSGTLNCDGTQTAPTSVYQGISPAYVGMRFKVRYTISGYSAGTVYPKIFGQVGTVRSANGTYEETITTSSGTAFFYFVGDADFIGSIGNVTVRPDLTIPNGTYCILADSNNTPTAGARAYLDLSTLGCVDGKQYTINFTGRHVGAGGAWAVRLWQNNDLTGSSTWLTQYVNTETTNQAITYTFKYSANTRYLILSEDSGSNDGGMYIDALSVKQTGNLIENGEFITDQAWTKGTGWTISGGVATHTGATVGALIQGVDVDVGNYYVLGITTSGSASSPSLTLSTSNGAFRNGEVSITANGTFYTTILCTHTHADNELYFTCTNTITIDNITLRRAYPVRGANALAPEIYGELVEVPYNTGSEGVALANWSDYNYLKMPYSSTLDPGTGDLSFSCWIKQAVAVNGWIINRDSSPTGKNFGCNMNGSGYLRGGVDDNTYDRQVVTAQSYADGVFHHLAITYDQSAGIVSMYVDGVLYGTATGVVMSTLTNTSSVLKIGGLVSSAAPFTGGHIAGIKIEIGALWTDQQILQDYNSSVDMMTKELEIFRINGDEVELVMDQANCSMFDEDNIQSQRSLSLSRQTLYHGSKEGWNVQSKLIPVDSENEPYIKQVRHFISSVKRGTSFTFDQLGEEHYNDDPRSVYLDSKDHGYSRQRDMNYYTFSLRLIEK